MADLRASIRIDLVDGASANAKAIEAATERLRQSQLRAAQAAQVVARSELQSAQAALEAAQGKGDSAEAAERLARAELRAAKASARLAQAEITAARASAEHAQSQGQAAAAMGRQSAAAGTATTATKGVSDAAKRAGRGYAENVNLVSELALGFGNLSPATRGAAMAFAGAGNNAFAMANAMGPLGVGLAVVLGLLPSMIAGLSSMGDEAAEAGNKAAEAASKFNELIDARLQERRDRERQRAIDTGEADSDEITAAVEVDREEAAAARRRANVVDAGEVRRRGGLGEGLAALLDEDRRAGLGEQLAGGLGNLFGEGGFGEGVRRARGETLEEARRREARAERRQSEALPTALAREEQESREERVGSAREAAAVAQRALGRQLERLGLDERRRSRIEQAASAGRTVELPALVRGLPADTREQVLSGAQRTADAAALAERAQREADALRVRQLDEARSTERSRGGDDLGVVRVDSGGAGGTRSEFVTARSDDPTEAANTQRSAAELNLEAARAQLRAAQIAAENARRGDTRIDTGPTATGGTE